MSRFIDHIGNEVDFQQYCLVLADGTKVYRHVPECQECGEEYFTDELGDKISAPDLTDARSCEETQVECRESQEWTYGIDNTGTRFNDVAEYKITLSDGSTLNFSQDGSSTSWTPQLQEWATNIQAAANAAGLAWFVEPRFVDTRNPENIDGTIGGPGGTASGLPGAPSVPVAIALDAGGMTWRYVNIQICPGQPVPVSAERISSRDFTNNPYQLTTAGAVLGPINKFKVCVECEEQDKWQIFDKSIGEYREANAGEIPNCWEPCGTLSLTEAPPDRACEFFFDLGCDNLNQGDPNNFIQQITRRATVCSGEQIAVDYFTEDPTDPAALIGYTLVGDFVDCDTGQPIEIPPIEGVLVDCEGTTQAEEHDQKVQIQGSKNPLPVFIVDNCDKDPNFESISEVEVCADGVPAIQKTVLQEDGTEVITYIGSNGVLVTPTEVIPGSCTKTSECIKWRNKYIGIDNTGSTFNVDQTIEIRDVDNNVVGTFVATASGDNTEQLNKWIAGLQSFYPNALIEQRYAPSGGAGLPPPTVGVDFDQMAARYVQFTACDGDDLPQSLYIIESNGNPTNILMDTQVIFGDEVRGYICYECGQEPVLFYTNGDKIPEADIPPCYITCSEPFSEEEKITTESISEVEICVNGVTAIEKTIVLSDGVESKEYRDDSGVISTPTSFTYGKCECEVFDYYEIDSSTITNTLRNREWHDTEPATGVISDEETAIQNGTGFRERHDFTLTPDTDNTSSSLELNDTNNTANELDIQVKDGYIIATEQIQARYSGTSEGYWAVELGTCCSDLGLIAESGGFSSNPIREMLFTIPKGIHRIRIWNIDNGGSNSSATFSYSTDGGLSYTANNTPPNLVLSENKPEQLCKQGYLCGGNYFELDKTTPVVFSDTLSLCKLECQQSSSSSEGGGGTASNVTVDNFPDQCPEIDLTLTVQTGTGNIPAGFKSVTINNLSGITTINGGFELGTGRRVDSISFGTDRSNCTNELLPAYTVVSSGNSSHQWIGHRE